MKTPGKYLMLLSILIITALMLATGCSSKEIVQDKPAGEVQQEPAARAKEATKDEPAVQICSPLFPAIV